MAERDKVRAATEKAAYVSVDQAAERVRMQSLTPHLHLNRTQRVAALRPVPRSLPRRPRLRRRRKRRRASKRRKASLNPTRHPPGFYYDDAPMIPAAINTMHPNAQASALLFLASKELDRLSPTSLCPLSLHALHLLASSTGTSTALYSTRRSSNSNLAPSLPPFTPFPPAPSHP